ncbi:MAG: hydantoinase/oxoprolinase family protein [Actinobacteria bacterium]|nr:hydantoinase/oxoprolinase family protein [Actinomycetota bacterium]
MSYRVGIDTGGTFTDLVVVADDGAVELFKTPSTPAEPHEAIGNALELASRARGATVPEFLDGCELIIHGTTVALNALLTLRGARTGLLCTAGHEDSLEIRLGHKEDGHRYDFAYAPAPMLVPRRLRLPVRERVLADGSVRQPLEEDDVRAAAELFRAEGVEAVGVCFLWSFRNPAHEQRAAEILAAELPGVPVTASAELLPQLGEYVRANTVAVNSYVQPRLGRHVEQVEGLLQSYGYSGSLRYVQSNGGLTGGGAFVRRAAAALNSGPAAAPSASSYFAGETEAAGIVTLDMGGTSADMSITEESAAADLVKDATVGRYPIGLPMVNVVSIGAGGGSIASVDGRGILRVGPESAEAMPGPACYQRGGVEPTVTDALAVLGYLNQEALLGGELPISVELAREAVRSRVAEPLGISVERAALGVFEVINANMVAGVRTVTVERGHDPRDFALLTGGGATAAHAGRLAADLGIDEVLIPRVSSGLCAFGEAIADAKHTLVGSYPSPLPELDAARLESLLAELEERGRQQLREEGFADEEMWSERYLDMKYIDQVHQCSVKIPEFEIVPERLGEIADAFHARHEALYTYSEHDNVPELLNLEVTVYGRSGLPPREAGDGAAPAAAPQPRETRPAFFAEHAEEARQTPVFAGEDIGVGAAIQGPAVIEEPTTTIVVFPGWELRLVAPDLYRMARAG